MVLDIFTPVNAPFEELNSAKGDPASSAHPTRFTAPAGCGVQWGHVRWAFPAALGKDGWVNAPAELPADYTQLLDHLKSQVRQARVRATRIVNTELLSLYWDIGHAIVQRQEAEGWGSKVIDRLAVDLRSAFPDMRGLSRTNLKYMRQ
uniref:DUF1016 N-terminal domain-containing protein n=1 Tax=Rhodococcus qingshengii TaxID=334542 RepID=UPI001F35E534